LFGQEELSLAFNQIVLKDLLLEEHFYSCSLTHASSYRHLVNKQNSNDTTKIWLEWSMINEFSAGNSENDNK